MPLLASLRPPLQLAGQLSHIHKDQVVMATWASRNQSSLTPVTTWVQEQEQEQEQEQAKEKHLPWFVNCTLPEG